MLALFGYVVSVVVLFDLLLTYATLWLSVLFACFCVFELRFRWFIRLVGLFLMRVLVLRV